MQKIYFDKELGDITLKKYKQSRQYTIRIRRGKIYVSMPYLGSYKKAMEFVNENKKLLTDKLKEYKPVQEAMTREKIAELKNKAKEKLFPRLHYLANNFGFNYNDIKISQSKSRWGSCSSKKNINLSFYLLLLPDKLIDYVLLHELCHTVHMNHSKAFWELLEQICNGKAKELRKELQKFHFPY